MYTEFRIFIKMQRFLAFLIGTTIVIGSCKKDTDEQAPIIQIESPNAGQVITLPDTLLILANISDDRQVKSVRVSIVDEENVSRGPVFINTYSSPIVNFNIGFLIEDLSLESGSYSLQVTASDGENETKVFIPIVLIEIPKQFLGLVYSREQGEDRILRIEMADGTQSEQLISSSSGHFDIENLKSRVFVSQFNDRTLTAYDFGENLNENWEHTLLDLPAGHGIEQVRFDSFREEVIVNTGTGGIYLYRSSGSQVGYLSMEPIETCQDLVANETEIWLGVSSAGGQNSLVQIYRDSGVRGAILPLSFIPQQMCWYSNSRIAMSLDNGDIHLKNPSNGSVTPLDIPGEQMVLSMKSYNGELFVLKNNQLYKVSSSYQIQGIYSGVDIRDFEIDEVNGRVFLLEGNTLKTFNLYPWFQQSQAALLPEPESISLIYNK